FLKSAPMVEIDGRLDQADEGSPYSVGVDGGGTKTLAIVVDAQGRECGRGLAGSANYNVVGLEQAVHHIHSAVEQAASMAGCQLPLSRAWLGIAGIDRPTDQDALLPHLHSLANIINLTNDAQLVLSGLDKAVGVALIAGTGSIALGRDAQGNTARAGGWGHVLGDEGSGYTIGRMALQVAVRAADGRGPATTLLELIMQHWQLHTASDIIGQVYPAEDKASIAHISALVFTAARAGDLLARKIIQQAANELALAVAAVGAALSFPADQLPLALGGGLLVHEKDFRQQVIRRIRRQRPNGQMVVVDQPALSAARAALDWHILPA
ncbi:MAG TPA: BadF/BadG/BcrA/BcrD ATPase family protein, partial [Ktedonobacteraceae bacterium]|nr:BadF/BadG/BcrA/BcrD ATPase family protein [Ktedonobacteraceae bacterium]